MNTKPTAHLILLAGISAALVGIASSAHGVEGGLAATTWGSPNGYVRTDFAAGADVGQTIAVQTDGRIVVVGSAVVAGNKDFALARYNNDGSLDTTFNTTGKVTTAMGAGDDEAYFVAIQTDGRIVVAGYSANGANKELALARYTTAGALDTTFNTTGKIVAASGTDAVFNCLTLQSDGKIVALGRKYNGASYDVLVARYTTAGALDSTFNINGLLQILGSTGNEFGNSVVMQPDGKILIGGTVYTGASSDDDFMLIRLAANGAMDTTFGGAGTGIVVRAIGSGASEDKGYYVALQSDGKIVLGGSAQATVTNRDFAVARFTAAGGVDTTFAPSGYRTQAIGTGNDEATSMNIQWDGKIVLYGYSSAGATNNLAAVRYTSSGALDTTFNTTGIATLALATGTITNGSWITGQTLNGVVAPNGNHQLVATGGDSGDLVMARWILDTTASVTVIAAPVDGSSTNVQAVPVSGTSEPYATVTVSEGVTALGSAPANATGAWTVTTSTLAAGAHTLTASGLDAAGNVGSASTASTVTIDLTPPTLAITPTGTTTAAAQIVFTLTFSEPVAIFTDSLITVNNGVKGVRAGSGTTWTITVTPSAAGAVGITAAANSAYDLAGNGLAVAASATVTSTIPPPAAAGSGSGSGGGCGLGSGLSGLGLFGCLLLAVRRRRS